ncbi:hypothetical protein IEQ34_011620 [Dendrobium chrysotoxum]|uniref:Uncharacterized protein n=1 Tax=Dendrobium chrysotoxum TaxID=161865 RepID=A0AAV7GQB5_DENCH|nr:hypothetical protein IEQ34_011620 [Dendrobium chrysotoxum]
MATSKVVGCIFFAADELLRMEELAVASGPHLINNSWFQIYKNSSGNMFPCSSLTEEGDAGTEREDSSTRPGERRFSFSLFLGEVEVEDVRDEGPMMRRETSGSSDERAELRRASAMFRRPDATWLPSWRFVRLRGRGSSRGCLKLTERAPFTVTAAPSERRTFLRVPAST